MLSNTVPRKSFLTMDKSFIRLHLGYGDVVYDQPNNETFLGKLESVQYNAVLAITRPIKGPFREKNIQRIRS